MESPGTVAPVVGQRNSVEIFVNALEKAFRSSRVYTYASGQSTFESILNNVLGALEKCFSDSETLEVDVKPFEMLFEKKMIYQNKEKKTSLSYALFQDGIRLLIFRRGMERDELREVIQFLGTDFSKPEVMDEDLYCLFVERNFPHFQVVGADAIHEAQEKNPQLKVEMFEFEKSVSTKAVPVSVSQPRKLRSEDLRILEEFRLNPAQFAKSDDEMQRVIQGITSSREGSLKERETLERLLLMGFHFLVHDRGDGDQLLIGRDLVEKTAVVALEAKLFDLFQAVVRKIFQLQKDRLDRSGEYQKIIDGIFHINHLKTFAGLLKAPEHYDVTTKILLQGPPSVVRLMILLLGEQPQVGKIFSDPILRNLPAHITWVLEEIQKNPQSDAWEHLINIMALKPTHHFQKILEVMIGQAGSTIRLKVLKQLASIGSPEALKVFEQILKGPDAKERTLVYDLLAHSGSRSALKLLRAHMDSPAFRDFSTDEREHAYATIARMGGELALPWFEALWMTPGSGLFKKKVETERRIVLVRALQRAGGSLTSQLLTKVPPETVTEEVKAILQRGKK